MGTTEVSRLAAGPCAAVRILYGSETGSAESVAAELAEALDGHGLTATLGELDQQPLEDLREAGIALIIVSTYGEGDMPWGAERFWYRLDSDDAPSYVGLQYAVLALGDRSYTHFCRAGASIDERFAQLGATRIAERIDCDADYEQTARAWIQARATQLDSLVAHHGSPVAGAAGGSPGDDHEAAPSAAAEAPPAASSWTRQHPFAARLARVVPLSAPGSHKEVVHYELDLAGSGISLQPGDSLAVIPRNDDFAVNQFLAAAGVSGAQPWQGRTFQSLAGEQWELRFPTAALLGEIGLRAPHSPLGALVRAADRDGVDEWVRQHNLVEALRALPEPIPAARLGELMGPIRYRAYSVASSPSVHPDLVHLTVATNRVPEQTGMRSGVASGYLADRVRPGEEVDVFPLPNRHFRLPDDPAAPIIMIGPGVGIAPFRAFLQERAHREAAGSAWLFLGDRHERTDYLYREDWERFLALGVLTRLDTAFSRDQADKVYVQTRMREQAGELAAWLREGAHFYLCGDARMAPAVEAELEGLVVDQLGTDEGLGLLEELRAHKRLHVDVY